VKVERTSGAGKNIWSWKEHTAQKFDMIRQSVTEFHALRTKEVFLRTALRIQSSSRMSQFGQHMQYATDGNDMIMRVALCISGGVQRGQEQETA
jgi:hypothetical protein